MQFLGFFPRQAEFQLVSENYSYSLNCKPDFSYKFKVSNNLVPQLQNSVLARTQLAVVSMNVVILMGYHGIYTLLVKTLMKFKLFFYLHIRG